MNIQIFGKNKMFRHEKGGAVFQGTGCKISEN